MWTATSTSTVISSTKLVPCLPASDGSAVNSPFLSSFTLEGYLKCGVWWVLGEMFWQSWDDICPAVTSAFLAQVTELFSKRLDCSCGRMRSSSLDTVQEMNNMFSFTLTQYKYTDTWFLEKKNCKVIVFFFFNQSISVSAPLHKMTPIDNEPTQREDKLVISLLL